MPASRSLFRSLAIADVALFLIAVAFNNHSGSSVDGIVWWIAIGLFVVMIVAGTLGLLQYLKNRAKRPRRSRAR
jgi:steroid 5-alpha reductase family enzyme